MNEVNSARAQFYQLLSSLFAKEVDSALRDELIGKQGQSLLQHLASEPEFKTAVDTINHQLSLLSNERQLFELAADYCGLFLVDGKQGASPYCGQYLQDNKTELFGQYHQKMTEVLAQGKLQLSSKFPEPADHIAAILAYLGYLCSDASRSEQSEFIRHYLQSWLNTFADTVNKHDQGGFYGALANLTNAWLTFDLAFLDDEALIGAE